MTSVPFSPFKSARLLYLPEIVSNKLKSGAIVPKGIILEGVADIVFSSQNFLY
jgi:hypothetical protein